MRKLAVFCILIFVFVVITAVAQQAPPAIPQKGVFYPDSRPMRTENIYPSNAPALIRAMGRRARAVANNELVDIFINKGFTITMDGNFDRPDRGMGKWPRSFTGERFYLTVKNLKVEGEPSFEKAKVSSSGTAAGWFGFLRGDYEMILTFTNGVWEMDLQITNPGSKDMDPRLVFGGYLTETSSDPFGVEIEVGDVFGSFILRAKDKRGWITPFCTGKMLLNFSASFPADPAYLEPFRFPAKK